MQQDDQIIEDLIVGGLIGAALGALITNSNKDAGVGVIAGAAILASYKANERARETNIPLLIEEEDVLYKISPDGSKKFIKSFPKSPKHFPKKFTLK